MLTSCRWLASLVLAAALAGCAAQAPVAPAGVAIGEAQAAGKTRDRVALAMFIGMDDYTGVNTLPEIQEAHRRLAQVGSGPRADLFLCGDSSEKGDGFRTRVTKQQGWGQGFEHLGELQTNRTPDLRNYLAWAQRQAGTPQMHVSISTHGGGYAGILLDHDGKPEVPAASMTLKKAFKALSKGYSGGRIPSLTFDACMMASIEVGEALKGTVEVMTGSEDFSMGGSIPWDDVAGALASGKLDRGEAFGAYVSEAVIQRGRWGDQGSLTWSAIALDQRFERTVDAVDRLSTALLKAMPSEGPAIRQAVDDTRMFAIMKRYADHYGDYYQRDLIDFTQTLRRRVKNPLVQKAAEDVERATKATVVALAKHPSESMANGLAIYLPHRLAPKMKKAYLDAYTDSVFARHTHWDEFLQALNP